MLLNRILLESSEEITKHFMTDKERLLRKSLCQLLIDKGHRKYAERFFKFDFNLVDSKKHPKFTAAVSFEDATVFLSDGFLGAGKRIFDQLDVLLRHELAHNLLMHLIRLMYVLKKRHEHDAVVADSEMGSAYDRISASASLHDLLNIIEDFDISNTRYSEEDKNIVRTMELSGRVIGGLVTEDKRPGWQTMSLEEMFEALTQDLEQINKDIRNNPYWQPTTDGWSPRETAPGRSNIDPIKMDAAKAMSLYADTTSPSTISGDFEDFMHGKCLKLYGGGRYAKLLRYLYTKYKEYEQLPDKQAILDQLNELAATAVHEPYELYDPYKGNLIETIYTPEEKHVTAQLLKYICGIVKPKVKVVRAQHSPAYIDAHNKTITALDKKDISSETLEQILQQLS